MPEAVKNALDLAQNLGGILLVVFYASIVLWTYKDARRRIDDPILVATAVATSMLPIVGVLVYMMLRPPEYLADVRERELEIRAMERTLGRQERCPYCRSHIESDYRSCPICMSKLRQACNGCERPLDPRWAMCPFCETEVARPVGGGDRPGRRDPRHEGGSRASRPDAASRPARRSGGGASPGRGEETAPMTPPRQAPKRGGGSDPGETIHTEPFSAARPQRFVRTDGQPTMIHTGPSNGGDPS